jgi:hypothetical protein
MIKFFKSIYLNYSLFLLIGLVSCTKEYTKPQFISEEAKSYLPFGISEKLVFKKSDTDSIVFNTSYKFYRKLEYQSDGQDENISGMGTKLYREYIQVDAFLENNSNRKDHFLARLYIDDDHMTGQDYELLNLSLIWKSEEMKMSIIAGENYYSGILYLNNDLLDSIVLRNKTYYDVFTNQSYFPHNVFYYTQDLGIIGFTEDTAIWMNAIYY